MNMDENIKYYQDKEKGMTVAILTCTRDDAEATVDKRIGRLNFYDFEMKPIPNEIRGITHLQSGDSFSAEYGKERAKRKALSTRKKLINAEIRNLVKRLIRDAVQLDKDAALKEMDAIYAAEKKRSVKDGD